MLILECSQGCYRVKIRTCDLDLERGYAMLSVALVNIIIKIGCNGKKSKFYITRNVNDTLHLA
jgi:hypothetical protein